LLRRTSAFEPCSTNADAAAHALAHQPAAHPRAQDPGGGAVHLRALLVHVRTVRCVVAQRFGVLVLPRPERVVVRHGHVQRSVVKGVAFPRSTGVGLEAAEGVPVDGRTVEVGGQRGLRGGLLAITNQDDRPLVSPTIFWRGSVLHGCCLSLKFSSQLFDQPVAMLSCLCVFHRQFREFEHGALG